MLVDSQEEEATELLVEIRDLLVEVRDFAEEIRDALAGDDEEDED